ncbi:SDR family oxidoreductase [Variovorax ginsengisoli]|uniref:Short-subunit dehydrogenase n=1 Tax=Variovorax ginsengisoli TaxID=363844 RepID=A0ABT9SBW6_9BURK|nr:SDR family oxidoreductase [Variovorax ginsengisoli]MDP9901842.1 short-subunit dehydrogenase [Variovorax ginsengisoli]
MKAKDARVLLTGATGGIGQAAAAALVGAGASVMLLGRSPARLAAQARALARTCTGAGAHAPPPSIEWYAADLTRTSSLAGIAEVAAGWGCNVLVHNAGVPAFGRIESFATNEMAQVLHLNLFAPMLLTQALLPHLRSCTESRVVFVGSVLGRLGLPGFSVYSASKFGLRGFAESLRRELGGTSVGVQYLGPRSTRTAFNSDAVDGYNKATGTAMDAPEVAARALLQLIESGAAERFLGFPESLAVRLNGVAPGLLDGSFRKHRESLPPVTTSPTAVLDGTLPRDTPAEADSHSLMRNAL